MNQTKLLILFNPLMPIFVGVLTFNLWLYNIFIYLFLLNYALVGR